ncbi:MAG: tetratricopeptide repeat protein [Treponema sp.]|nr:tetratricopeptide repeat protein [Treponema sp.]
MKFMIKLILTIFFLSSIFASCGNSNVEIRRMQQMEEGVSNPTSIEEYKDAISKYEKRIQDIESATSQVGVWYKILGSRYLDQKMYGEALECYRKALDYYPDNQNLYYYVAICAGYMAHASLDFDASNRFEKRQNYLNLSESAYLRALAIDDRYTNALYGLAVLYVFYFDRTQDAIPHLEKLLTIDTGHTDAKLLLANAYYRTQNFQASVDMYDSVIKSSKDKEKKAIAENNKKQVLDELYLQQ